MYLFGGPPLTLQQDLTPAASLPIRLKTMQLAQSWELSQVSKIWESKLFSTPVSHLLSLRKGRVMCWERSRAKGCGRVSVGGSVLS